MKTRRWLILVLLVLVGVLLIAFNASRPPVPEESADNAFYIARQFVEKRLVAPRTAEWCGRREAFVFHEDDGTWLVRSCVDSQNSFGALLRTHYSANVRYEGNGQWRLMWLNTE